MTTINQAYNVVVEGVLSMSLLVLGNNGSPVIKNDLVNNPQINIQEISTLKEVPNSYLKKYFKPTWTNPSIKNIILNKKKIMNLNKLDQIESLQDGWDGNGAKAFKKQFISKIREILTSLSIQPQIFPLPYQSIQFEYDKEDGSYLEIEISSNDSWEAFQIDSQNNEKEFLIKGNINALTKVVNDFYG